MTKSFSLVLPCYNEEENIKHTINDVNLWIKKNNIDCEIICVDDGSTDSTHQILKDLSEEFSHLRIVTLENNSGYGAAIRAGLDLATKEVLGFMDSDRQFNVNDISMLLPHLEKYDFVTGRRKKRADSFIRNILGKILGLLTWIAFGLWVRDINCGMKIFRKDIWGKIHTENGTEKFFNTEIFLNLRREKIDWIQIPVPHYPRIAGTPNGASTRVIFGMIKEFRDLRKRRKF
ncbi:MAG: glycosyltransferase family 2 protein [Candidatus Peribacteraceae bacterium]|nr:glycosyltransferase family 2 protein [Candidatus Peribacteraceae bacterium]